MGEFCTLIPHKLSLALPPQLSSSACYVLRVLLSAFFIVLVVVVGTGAGSKVLRLLPALDRANMGGLASRRF